MSIYLWVGNRVGLTASNIEKTDQYCFNRPQNWLIGPSGNVFPPPGTSFIWQQATTVPTSQDWVCFHGGYDGPTGHVLRVQSINPDINTQFLNPVQYRGWTAAKSPCLFGGWSGGITLGSYSATGAASNALDTEGLANAQIWFDADYHQFPFVGGGISGDRLQWCAYRDGISFENAASAYSTSAYNRNPSENLKTLIGLGIKYTSIRPIAPNDIDQTPWLHTRDTKMSFKLTGVGGQGNNENSGLLVLPSSPSAEFEITGGYFKGLKRQQDLISNPFVENMNNADSRHLFFLAPEIDFNFGNVVLNDCTIINAHSISNYANGEQFYHDVINQNIRYNNCTFGRMTPQYANFIRLGALGTPNNGGSYLKLGVFSPTIQIVGCSFDYVTAYQRCFGPTAYVNALPEIATVWDMIHIKNDRESLSSFIGPKDEDVFIDGDLDYEQYRDSIEGLYSVPLKARYAQFVEGGFTSGASGASLVDLYGLDRIRNQKNRFIIGSSDSPQTTNVIPKLYVAPKGIPSYADGQSIPLIINSETARYAWKPTSIECDGETIITFAHLQGNSVLSASDTISQNNNIRIAELKLGAFGKLDASKGNPNFFNWRIGSITGGSGGTAGNAVGGIIFEDGTGKVIGSEGFRVWNTQTYNGYNTRQTNYGKTSPTTPGLGLP